MFSRGSVMCGEIIHAVCRWIAKASKVSGRYLQRQARNVFFFRFDIFAFLQQNKGKLQFLFSTNVLSIKRYQQDKKNSQMIKMALIPSRQVCKHICNTRLIGETDNRFLKYCFANIFYQNLYLYGTHVVDNSRLQKTS